MATKQAKSRPLGTESAVEPAPGTEADPEQLGAHASLNPAGEPPSEGRERLSARMHRTQDYQGP